MATYNRKKRANSGRNKWQQIKQRMEGIDIYESDPTNKMSYQQRIAEALDNQGIDINDPNGWVIYGDKFKYKEHGSPRTEPTELTALLNRLTEQNVFQQLEQKVTSPEEMIIRTIDLNDKIAINKNQQFKSFSSLNDIKRTYDEFERLRKENGRMFIFDTETYGGKTSGTVWTPMGITEFSMREVNMSDGSLIKKTNIVLGIAPTKENEAMLNEIERLLKSGRPEDIAKVEKNEAMRITAHRMALYDKAKLEKNSFGYYEAISLPESDEVNWKDPKAFVSGRKKMTDAFINTDIDEETGLKTSVLHFFQSTADMDKAFKDGTGMGGGQNFVPFDMPVMNMQLKQYQNLYNTWSMDNKIINNYMGTTETVKKGAETINKYMAQMGGSFEMPTEKALDLLPVLHGIRKYYGLDAMYHGNREAIKMAGGGTAKQEYIARAFFADFFESAAAHMADADTEVLQKMFFEPVKELNNVSPYEYYMKHIKNQGLYNINSPIENLQVGKQLFYANTSNIAGVHDNMGKGHLNHITIDSTGERYYASGHQYIDGKLAKYDPDVNMGYNLTGDRFYYLDKIQKINVNDLDPELHKALPEFSGGELYHVQMKMATNNRNKHLDDITYNLYFNNEKEVAGFFSGGPLTMVATGEKGAWDNIVKGQKNLFDIVELDKENQKISKTKAGRQADKIAEAIDNKTDIHVGSKVNNSVFGNSSLRKTKQILEMRNLMRDSGVKSITKENAHQIFKGIPINNTGMTVEQATQLQAQFIDIISYEPTKGAPKIHHTSTINNITGAWNVVAGREEFYNAFIPKFEAYAEKMKWNAAETQYAYTQALDTIMQQAAMIYTGQSEGEAFRKAATGQTNQVLTKHQLANIYDIQLPENFDKTSSKVLNIETLTNPSEYRNVIRLNNINNESTSYKLTKELRQHMFGTKKIPGDVTDVQDREAWRYFVNEVLVHDQNFAESKTLKYVQRLVKEKDFNPDQVSKEVLKRMQTVKNKNKGAAIIKPITANSIYADREFNNILNKVIATKSDDFFQQTFDLIPNQMGKAMDENTRLDFIKQNVLPSYMPNKDAYKKAISGLSENEQWVRLQLYDKVEENITNQINDIFNFSTKIPDSKLHIDSNGNIGISSKGKYVGIDNIPKVRFQEETLFAQLGENRLTLSFALGFHETKSGNFTPYLSTNMGEVFERSLATSKRIQKSVEEGTFELDDVLNLTKKISKDLRESAAYAGMEDDVFSNLYFGTNDLNKYIPSLFGSSGKYSHVGKKISIPEKLRASLYDMYNGDEEIDADTFDPVLNDQISPYRVDIVQELVKELAPTDENLNTLVGTLNTGVKDKSKLGKGYLMAGGERFETGFWNPFEENSRPQIYSSGHAYYLDEKDIDEVAKTGKIFKGGLFESEFTDRFKLDRDDIGAYSTSFSGRVLYTSHDDIIKAIKENHDKLLAGDFGYSSKEVQEEAINALYGLVSTFEQAKVADAEIIMNLTKDMAQERQILTASKDLRGAMGVEHENTEKIYKRMWDLMDAFEVSEEMVSYKSKAGMLVMKGDDIFPYATFGGAIENWVSKRNEGVLQFQVLNEKNIRLSDEQIQDILNKNKHRFDQPGVKGYKARQIGVFNNIFEELGYKPVFVIEDVNKTTLPKILVNESEKSMNQLIYARIGSLDENVAATLEGLGERGKRWVGTTVPTSRALIALLDEAKEAKTLEAALTAGGFANASQFLQAAEKEMLTPNRMLFGEGGLFEGFVSIGNDNIPGHKNKGSIMNGALGQAIELLGKYSLDEDSDITAHALGMQKFVEMYNKNKDLQFFKDQNGNSIEIELKNGHLMLKEGARVQQDLDNYTTIDAERLENVLLGIDKILEDKNAPIQDRLTHSIKYDGETDAIEYVGNLAYLQEPGMATGSVGFDRLKILQDGETQTSTNQQYRDDLERLAQIKKERRELLKDINRADGIWSDSDIARDANLEDTQKELERRVANWEGTRTDKEKMFYKVGDQERDIIVRNNTLDKDYVELTMKNMQGKEIPESLRGLTVRDVEANKAPFQFLIDDGQRRLYYDPKYKGEELLTEDMLKEKRYEHLAPIYKNVTTDKGYDLGVESAEKLYDIRQVAAANKFNQGQIDIETLKNDYGFKVMTPLEYQTSQKQFNVNKDHSVVQDNVIIDLGDTFGSVHGNDYQYVAIPGMGSVVGDAEIKKDWHDDASKLVNRYLDKYQGEHPDRQLEAMDGIVDIVKDIRSDTDNWMGKNKNFHSDVTKVKIDAFTTRNKIMPTNYSELNPLMQNAYVGNKSLAEWMKEGVHHDFEFLDRSVFDQAGFFKEENYTKMGFNSIDEVEQHLIKYGTMGLDDRYPNIIKTSIVPGVHQFMNPTKHAGQAFNAALIAPHTMRKMNADSDGDSRTAIFYEDDGTNYVAFDKARMEAINYVDSQNGYADDIERAEQIKQRVLSQTDISNDTYDRLLGVQQMSELAARDGEQAYWVNEDVGKILREDVRKTKEAQSIKVGGEYTIAEFKGGTSVLGKEKLPSLRYNPTAAEVQENLDEVNAMLKFLQSEEVRPHVEQFSKQRGDRYFDILNTENIRDLNDETKALDDILTAYQDLRDNKTIAYRTSITDDYIKSLESTAKKRVRINNYQIEAMAKMGITATGSVNVNLFGITRASNAWFGNANTEGYNKRMNLIMENINYELEQSPISSKKHVVKAGDERLMDFNKIMRDIKKNGVSMDPSDKLGGRSNYDLMYEWMDKFVDTGKVVKQYKITNAHSVNPGKTLTKDNEIKDYMIKEYLSGLQQVMDYKGPMRKTMEIYSIVGRGSSSAAGIELARQGLLKGTLTYDAIESILGAIPEEQGGMKAPHTKAPGLEGKGIPKYSTKVTQETAENVGRLQKQFTNRLKDIDGKGVGGALAIGALSLAAGIIASGYASGNPLNDANPEKVSQEQTQQQINFGPENPQMAPNNTGGYIINIKGDTKEGNRQLKRAMKQAAKSSVGGGVNINMSLRTSRAGGYSNEDLESLLNDYL